MKTIQTLYRMATHAPKAAARVVKAIATGQPILATLELVGGIALILGLLTRVFAALLAVDMLGALFLVHAPAGIFVGNGG